MVFFTCNNCGQSVKKNQVEKHYQYQCHSSKTLGCMDCGKDFRGDDYMKHTKCISEDQKYGGKDFKAKPNSNKGEVKQEEWINHIQNTIATTKVKPALQNLLEQLTTFSNIPRKKAKFENFVKNGMRIYDSKLIAEAWDVFNQAQKKENDSSTPLENNNNNNNQLENNVCDITNGKPKHKKRNKQKADNDENIQEKKKKTKSDEANEKPKRKKEKKQKLDEDENVQAKKKKTELDEENEKPKYKKEKKRKLDEDENIQEKKKKIKSDEKNESKDISIISNTGAEKIKKFAWKKIIRAVLKEAPNNEISLKKLRKKVLSEYRALGGENRPMSENELYARFQKKIESNPKFKVHKDRVQLVK